MDQAGILRKFIQRVKAMSEGDEERGEDNFGSDFMVGQLSNNILKSQIGFFLFLHIPTPLSRLLISPRR